jgi:methyl-accepting chemotaxis protein
MQKIRDLKTSAKLLGLILISAIFLAGVGYVGLYYTDILAANMTDMYENRLLPVKYLYNSAAQMRAVEAITVELVAANLDQAQTAKLQAEIKERVAQNGKQLAAYEKTNRDPYEIEQWTPLQAALETSRVERARAFDIAATGNKQAAYAYYSQNVGPAVDKTNSILADLADYNAKKADEGEAQAVNANQNASRMIIIISVIALALSLTLGWVISRMISRPLEVIMKEVQQVANGNLAVESIKVHAQDDIGQLAQAFNIMVGHLQDLVKQVNESAAMVAASAQQLMAGSEQSAQAAGQIASTITEVAQGAERQLQSVDNTSAVVEQMSAGIQEKAASSTNVAGSVDKTSSAAQGGNKAVELAMTQMSHIERTVSESAAMVTKLGERSQQIDQIVTTISDIAGQTNLLALNAAIEAARAGEHGRGFAVVAEEVRKLAEQSREAAKKIADLIGDIQAETTHAVAAMDDGTQEVKRGTEVVNNAGQTFKEIAALVEQVSGQVREIAAAIQQMAGGSGEIVNEVQEIDKISKQMAERTQTISAATEEQSASMEEVAASSQSLAKMAEELQAAVKKFTV